MSFIREKEQYIAQISISDESYQKIETLAQECKLTPEQLIDFALVQLEIAQERAEYGDAFIEELRQQANAPAQHLTFYGSTEEFLQSVRDAPYALSGDKVDADL